MKAGESPYVKYKGKGTIAKFQLIHKGEVIEPWKGKDAEVMEWLRNSSALLGERREEIATLWKVEEADIYYEESIVPNRKMKKAFFTAERDGREYDVAARLLDDDIKPTDRVQLTIMGCCSLIGAKKIKPDADLITSDTVE